MKELVEAKKAADPKAQAGQRTAGRYADDPAPFPRPQPKN